MRSSIHPDRPVLFVRADGFVDGDQLMRDRITFLPDSHLERTAMNILDDVNLALVLRKRQAARSVGQSPLPGLIVNR